MLVPITKTSAVPSPVATRDLARKVPVSYKLFSVITFLILASGSPVRSASIQEISYPAVMIISAGTFIPFSMTTKSPTTKSLASIVSDSVVDPLKTATYCLSESLTRSASLFSDIQLFPELTMIIMLRAIIIEVPSIRPSGNPCCT